MAYSKRSEIFDTKDDTLLNYRQARNHKDNLGDKWQEAEALYVLLIFQISQAKNEDLEPYEFEELDDILKEVKDLRETVRDEIKGQLASL